MSSASAARMRAIAAGISDPQSGSCAIPNPVRRDSSVIVTSRVTAVPPTCPSSIFSAFFASSRSPSTRRCASGRRSAVAGSTSGSSGVVSKRPFDGGVGIDGGLEEPVGEGVDVRDPPEQPVLQHPPGHRLRGCGFVRVGCAAVRVGVLGDFLQVRQQRVDVPALLAVRQDLRFEVVDLVRRETGRGFGQCPPHRGRDLRVQESVGERGGDLREPRRQRLPGERVLPGPERVTRGDHRPRHRP